MHVGFRRPGLSAHRDTAESGVRVAESAADFCFLRVRAVALHVCKLTLFTSCACSLSLCTISRISRVCGCGVVFCVGLRQRALLHCWLLSYQDSRSCLVALAELSAVVALSFLCLHVLGGLHQCAYAMCPRFYFALPSPLRHPAWTLTS